MDIPLNNKKVVIRINNRKMFCDNNNCSHKTFAEVYDFVERKSKKTKRLKEYILDISVNMSSISAQNLLRKNGVEVSKSTICTFLKKDSIEIDTSSITCIGIDDFAIKKRHKYATIMVNQANHTIISAINSREITDIQKWLQQYPNLKIVSRDGSSIYKLAIELANPDIIQVSDRFHLIKGLSEAIREEVKNNT